MGRSPRDRAARGARTAAAALLAAAALAGCKPSTLLHVSFDAATPPGDAATLKIRLRALDADASGVRVVANELPARDLDADELAGEFVVAIAAEDGSPLAHARALVEVLLYAEPPETVDAAFAALDDPVLRVQSCALPSGTSVPCSHVSLAALTPLGAATLVVDHLGRSDADVSLFALGAGAGAAPDGDLDTIPAACPEPPATCAPEGTDCEPTLIDANPFEVEEAFQGLCLDSIDQDCSGELGPCIDLDMDGYVPPDDCDDNSPVRNPGIEEDGDTNCSDGVDNDCDGMDSVCNCDVDLDGFCPVPTGNLPGGDCCEDGSETGSPGCSAAAAGSIYPGAPDFCENGVDEDCDGGDAPCGSADADGDGHCAAEYGCSPAGNPPCQLLRSQVNLTTCDSVFDDCADWDAGVHPGAVEDCGGADRDCDGSDPPCGADADGDGWDDTTADCGPGDPDVHPGAGEVCGNGVDDDCAGGDVPCSPAVDGDSDGYVACAPGVLAGCDCDDGDAGIHPGAAEACDGVDQDCDGDVDDGNPGLNAPGGAPLPCYGNPIATATPYTEVSDGVCRYGAQACSAGAPLCILFIGPQAVESCNGYNDQCTTTGNTPNLPTIELDSDGDGFRRMCTLPYDCCDGPTDPTCAPGAAATAAAVYPGAPEVCTTPGVDNDCNGDATEATCGVGETCPMATLECTCGGTSAPSGEACPNTSSNPVCGTSGCWCDANSTCDADEACIMASSRCACGGTSAGGGAACPDSSANPVCLGTACGCDADSTCDSDESCDLGTGHCTCGTTTPAAGAACLNSSTTAPDCASGSCRCQASVCGPLETCTGPGGDCACGATTAGTGEACPNAGAAPDCMAGVGCRCQASLCGPMETCTGAGGDCACGATTAAVGEACVGAAPDCFAGVGCRCGDAATTCGAMETCNATGDCACGPNTAASGEACPAGPNPTCIGATCACDVDSTCDPDEACDAAMGRCLCGGTGPLAGPACPAAGANPNCVAGACACDADSTCGAGETCGGGACACGATVAPAGPACMAPLTCVAGTCA